MAYFGDPNPGICPHCGYCRHCGRGGHGYWGPYPWYPNTGYPYVSITGSTTDSTGTITTYEFNKNQQGGYCQCSQS